METKIKILVLDFDNCILLDEKTKKGSEDIKDEAWFDVFPECDKTLLKITLDDIKKNIAGGKGDRKDIVYGVCKKFNLKSDVDEINIKCKKFGEIVKNEILEMGVSTNVFNTISSISKKIPIYVNTATPKEDIVDILEKLGLISFLKGVYGRPETKLNNLFFILKKENITAEHCLFVDDQKSGLEISRIAGCQFVGIRTIRNSDWNTHNYLGFPLIDSLLELIQFL